MLQEWADPTQQEAATSRHLQLHLDLGGQPAATDLDLPAGLGGDDLALRSQLQKQGDRIQALERALDQSMIVVAELRQQLVHQQFLEDQLAATEEIANIQQQAITQLKQQLAQQQATTAQTLPTLLPQSEAAIAAGVAYPSEATSPLLPKLADFTQQLETRQHIIEQLETELDRAHLELQAQQTLIDRLQRQTDSATVTHNPVLDQELFAAHCKIQDLELQISKHLTTQAILQHTCQELEQVRDRYHSRAQELELQTADMQEQILHQAQQASEYQTAIQHWKDRYVQGQDYLSRLSALVPHLTIQPTPELTELLAVIQILLDTPEPEEKNLSIGRPPKMDIPDFLARHQRYRVRS